MGQKQTGTYCPHCQKNVLAVGKTPNHVLHLILTILTFGLWGVVWVISTLSSIGGFRCTQCGNVASTNYRPPGQKKPIPYGSIGFLALLVIILLDRWAAGAFNSKVESTAPLPTAVAEQSAPAPTTVVEQPAPIKKVVAEKIEGREFRVPSDAKARYFMLEQSRKGSQATTITKRVGSSGTAYSKRLYDCKKQQFKYLGTGETLQAMNASKPDPKMSSLVEGSISYYVMLEACK